MNILIISPNAPPKNSPESIQAGRYLQELDKKHHIILVTTPVESGWITADSGLHVALSNTDIMILKLTFHKIVARFLASRYFRRLLVPDKDFWIASKGAWLTKQLHLRPDVIYSRSLPVSAALLAFELKKKLSLPWIMHLSDPWGDNPYVTSGSMKRKLTMLEVRCFEAADAINVTTDGIAEFYRSKYQHLADKISVFPNVMPNILSPAPILKNGKKKLSLIYTGALYGQRRPTTILKALNVLKCLDQRILNLLEVKFIGNITDEIRQEIDNCNVPNISILGKRNYSEVLEIQAGADIMVSIEPDGDNPILKTFLPSKMLDYIAGRKPVLAITPENSESWKLCNRGYGWAIRPDDHRGLALLLNGFLNSIDGDDWQFLRLKPFPPDEFSASFCVEKLSKLMATLLKPEPPGFGGVGCMIGK